MEGLEALARKFQDADDFNNVWNCDEFVTELKLENSQEEELSVFLFAYCRAVHELQDYYKKFREHQNATKYHHVDDDDCTGFDEMESHQFWVASLKANIRRAKRSVDDYWTEYILDNGSTHDRQKEVAAAILLQLPIIRENPEEHDSSDCDSTCSTCEAKQNARSKLAESHDNSNIKLFSSLLLNAPNGKKLTFNARPISISQYLEHYAIGETWVKLQFIKSHYKRGVIKDRDKIIIYHTGQLDELPKLCDYFLPRRFDGNKSLPEKPDNVKILLQDDIFEEYVHIANGFIIFESEIKCHSV
jgi:hypothetical protein